jgi:XTP/dITP diphosphohydrolase
MEQILQGCGIRIMTMAHFSDQPFEPEETGSTYMANAEIKALAACRITDRVCVADDAGLEIDALDGAPGVYSRRWSESSRCCATCPTNSGDAGSVLLWPSPRRMAE